MERVWQGVAVRVELREWLAPQGVAPVVAVVAARQQPVRPVVRVWASPVEPVVQPVQWPWLVSVEMAARVAVLPIPVARMPLAAVEAAAAAALMDSPVAHPLSQPIPVAMEEMAGVTMRSASRMAMVGQAAAVQAETAA